MDNPQKTANPIESAVPVSRVAISVKYGVIGACSGLAFAIVIAFFEAQWSGTHIPTSFISDGRGR